jgi:succinate dehydrogenase / fumarate reductase membrane anchor subunit
VSAYTKNPVGAHYGTGDWLLQRLTAVVMVVYTLGLIACIAWHAPASQADWKAIFSGTVAKLATMTFFASLLYHAWVGMRDIFMDYVKATGIRLALQMGTVLVLLAYLFWAASILWGRA